MIPGLPTGALDAATAALTAPLRALEEVVAALKSLGDAAVAVVPLFGVVGDKLQQLGELVKVTFRDNIGIPITNTLNAIGRALQYALPTDVIDWFQNSLGAVSRAVGGVGRAAVGIAVGIGAAVGVIVAAGYAMGQAVQKANPAVYEQFSLVINDLVAVIGQGLMPVFRLVTDMIRAFADTLVTFVAPIGEAVGTVLRPFVEVLKVVYEVLGRIGQAFADAAQTVAPALASIAQVGVEVFKAIQPVLDLLVNALGAALVGALSVLANVVEAVAPVVVALARAFGDLLSWVVRTVREILAFVGIDLPDRAGTRPGASVGAATRSAQISDVSSVIQQAQRSAFTLGAASGDPATRTASAAEALKAKADQIYDLLRNLPFEIAKALATGGVDYLADKGGSFARSVGGRVSDALGIKPVESGDFAAGARALGVERAVGAFRDFVSRRGGDGGGTVAPAP